MMCSHAVLTIERRIAALEASAKDSTMKIIIIEDGERHKPMP